MKEREKHGIPLIDAIRFATPSVPGARIVNHSLAPDIPLILPINLVFILFRYPYHRVSLRCARVEDRVPVCLSEFRSLPWFVTDFSSVTIYLYLCRGSFKNAYSQNRCICIPSIFFAALSLFSIVLSEECSLFHATSILSHSRSSSDSPPSLLLLPFPLLRRCPRCWLHCWQRRAEEIDVSDVDTKNETKPDERLIKKMILVWVFFRIVRT